MQSVLAKAICAAIISTEAVDTQRSLRLLEEEHQRKINAMMAQDVRRALCAMTGPVRRRADQRHARMFDCILIVVGVVVTLDVDGEGRVVAGPVRWRVQCRL